MWGRGQEIHPPACRAQADAGQAVLFVSSDLLETLEICDRLVVIAQGRTKAILENDKLTAEQVLACCYGEEEKG